MVVLGGSECVFISPASHWLLNLQVLARICDDGVFSADIKEAVVGQVVVQYSIATIAWTSRRNQIHPCELPSCLVSDSIYFGSGNPTISLRAPDWSPVRMRDIFLFLREDSDGQSDFPIMSYDFENLFMSNMGRLHSQLMSIYVISQP